ncbi:hypothetical protein CC2G_012198 [Coprinopsis cinerea AmutBmut pab1-1]|nr:hypothetical protein CC2G_012198 [Coprinopsis cinerea AmutBmut pab1-1]
MHPIATTTIFSAFLLSSALAQNGAEVITFYEPKLPTMQGFPRGFWQTRGASALSVDSEGYTHYVASQVQTLGVGPMGTYLSTPTAITYTFKADASHYHAVDVLRDVQPTNEAGDYGLVTVEGGKEIFDCVYNNSGGRQESGDQDSISDSEESISGTSSSPDSVELDENTIVCSDIQEAEKVPMFTVTALSAKDGSGTDSEGTSDSNDGVGADDDSGAMLPLKLGVSLVWLGITGGMSVAALQHYLYLFQIASLCDTLLLPPLLSFPVSYFNDGRLVTLFRAKDPSTVNLDWIVGETMLGVQALSTDAEGPTSLRLQLLLTHSRQKQSASRLDDLFRAVEPTGTAGGGLGLVEYPDINTITECEGDIDGSSDDTDMIACSMRLEVPVTPTPSGGPAGATRTPTPSIGLGVQALNPRAD